MKSDDSETVYTPTNPFNLKTEDDSDDPEAEYVPEKINEKFDEKVLYTPSKIDNNFESDSSPDSNNEVEESNDLAHQVEEPVQEEVDVLPQITQGTNEEYDPEISLGEAFASQSKQPVEDENDFEGFEEEEQVGTEDAGGMIADIFGESDAEEEFDGFAENEVQEYDQSINEESIPNKRRKQAHQFVQEYNDGSDQVETEQGFVSDFDTIMQKKKNRRSKRVNDVDIINDNDELVSSVITRMRRAAQEDRIALEADKPGYKKLSMIKIVTNILKKADIKTVLIENGMISAITDWLSPVIKHTLPNLLIRETLLKALLEFQQLSPDVLKESGIGKAVMYLFKHPKETRENKLIAARLINEWSRPIFNLQSDYRSLSKEERRKLNAQQVTNRSQREENLDESFEERPCKPGDPGFVSRARVPQPSTRDYVVAPKWNLPEEERHQFMNVDDYDEEQTDGQKQALIRKKLAKSNKPIEKTDVVRSRLEQNIRDLSKISGKKQRSQKAVSMSLEGRKMIL